MSGEVCKPAFCLSPLGDSGVCREEKVLDAKNVQTAVTDCSRRGPESINDPPG